jgi:hypothetical protein
MIKLFILYYALNVKKPVNGNGLPAKFCFSKQAGRVKGKQMQRE